MKKTLLIILIWLAAIVAVSFFDRAIANFMRDAGVAQYLRDHRLINGIWKFAGEYYFVLLIALIALLVHQLKWRAAGFVILATAVSGLNGLVKWLAGRTRPFKLPVYAPGTHRLLAEPFILAPLRGGWRGLFHESNLSFPSGHTALAFATATAVAMLWPKSRWRWLVWVLAVLVAFERIAENAHWPSDTVAGAGLGVAGVYIVHWLLMRYVYRQPHESSPALSLPDHPLLQRAGECPHAAGSRGLGDAGDRQTV